MLGAIACAGGLAKFYEVDPSDPIWVDPKSLYIEHKSWVEEKFPSEIRISVYIAESDNNLLTPQAMLEVQELINNTVQYSHIYDGQAAYRAKLLISYFYKVSMSGNGYGNGYAYQHQGNYYHMVNSNFPANAKSCIRDGLIFSKKSHLLNHW